MSTELDALTVGVTENPDVEASVRQLVDNIHDMLTEAGDDPDQLKALADALKTGRDALGASVVEGTPAEPGFENGEDEEDEEDDEKE